MTKSETPKVKAIALKTGNSSPFLPPLGKGLPVSAD